MQTLTLKNRGSMLPWIAIAVAALALGAWLGLNYFTPNGNAAAPLEVNGVYMDEPLDVVDFTLTAGSGDSFQRDNFKDRWTLIYFGYTFCPDVCPLTLGKVAKAQQLLEEQGQDADNAYLLVSVDPQRDTPQRLKEYTSSFHEKFQGATGDREELDKLTEAMGIFYQIHEPEEGQDYYLVDHSSALVLVNPDARVQAVLTPPFTPSSLAEDVAAIKARHIN